jgi:hypothetical protein
MGLPVFAVFLARLTIYAWWAPSSWLGQWATRWSVALVQRLSRTRPLTALLFLLFVAATVAIVVYAEMKGLFIAAPMGVEGFAYFAAIDVGTAVEAVAIAWLFAASGAVRPPALRAICSMRWISALRTASGRRQRRSRRVRLQRRPRNGENTNEDGAPIWAVFA